MGKVEKSDHFGPPRPPASVAVIVGSAFSANPPSGLSLHPLRVDTPWGPVTLYEALDLRSDVRPLLVFRHGLPHQTLPHLVNYRAYAFALKSLRCEALLITSSVGVLDEETPLDQALIVDDLLMPDQRLPSGEVCTMFDERSKRHPSHLDWTAELRQSMEHGHLVLREGLFSSALTQQLHEIIEELTPQDAQERVRSTPTVTFAYAPGPRTKTRAENRYWAQLGAQVNSMSLGPELVLANELEIPCAAVVIGHKRSSGTKQLSQNSTAAKKLSMSSEELETKTLAKTSLEAEREMTATLNRSHQLLESVILCFMRSSTPVDYQNYIYRFPPPAKK